MHKLHVEVRDLLRVSSPGGSGQCPSLAAETALECDSRFNMRPACLLAVTASILALAGADTTGPPEKNVGELVRSPLANGIEDSTKTEAVAPGAAGPRVTRAQVLLDRGRFSPGEIDRVTGGRCEARQRADDLRRGGGEVHCWGH